MVHLSNLINWILMEKELIQVYNMVKNGKLHLHNIELVK